MVVGVLVAYGVDATVLVGVGVNVVDTYETTSEYGDGVPPAEHSYLILKNT